MPKKITEQKVEEKKEKKEFYYAVGRRKEAVAQVMLYVGGEGKITINNKPAQEYFRGEIYQKALNEPFQVTNTLGRFTVSVKVKGSGLRGQLGAVIHGISRALVVAEPEKNRTLLHKKGYLTRDSRAKERRKIGQMGKARKKKQSPKR